MRGLYRVLIASLVLSAITCLTFWRFLNLPVCVGFVVGTSMAPAMLPGDFVVGLRMRPEVGSVVIYDGGGNLVIHRVVEVNSTHVVTRGDACVSNDPPTPLERVLCVVVFTVGGGIWVALALLTSAFLSVWVITKYVKNYLGVEGVKPREKDG